MEVAQQLRGMFPDDAMNYLVTANVFLALDKKAEAITNRARKE